MSNDKVAEEIQRDENGIVLRPWHWEMTDGSMMCLCGKDIIYDHVLACGICPACQKSGNICTAPSKEHRQYILDAVNNYDNLRKHYPMTDAQLAKLFADKLEACDIDDELHQQVYMDIKNMLEELSDEERDHHNC